MTSFQKIAEAYFAMATTAKYRPEAPSDGLGNIQLDDDELAEEGRLNQEASNYAIRFMKEEKTRDFFVGVSSFGTKQAFVWTLEAARSLAAVENAVALRLLKMAVADVERVMRAGAP